MAKTTEQLLQQAVQIRDEQANKKNTALRVGTLFSDIIEKQEESDQTHASDVTKINESINENKEKLSLLGNNVFRTGSGGYISWQSGKTYKDGDVVIAPDGQLVECIGGTVSTSEYDPGEWAATTVDEQSRKRDTKISNIANSSGNAICQTGGSTAAKTITVDGITEITDKLRLLVQMNFANTAGGSVTLNINKLGAKTLYYNGATVSATNTWETGEIVELYYANGAFQCFNAKGGSGNGGNMILEWKTDVSTTRKQVKAKDRKEGIQISYKNGAGKWINEQYIGTTFTDTEWAKDSNWEEIATQYGYEKAIEDLKVTPSMTTFLDGNVESIFDNIENSQLIAENSALSANAITKEWSIISGSNRIYKIPIDGTKSLYYNKNFTTLYPLMYELDKNGNFLGTRSFSRFSNVSAPKAGAEAKFVVFELEETFEPSEFWMSYVDVSKLTTTPKYNKGYELSYTENWINAAKLMCKKLVEEYFLPTLYEKTARFSLHRNNIARLIIGQHRGASRTAFAKGYVYVLKTISYNTQGQAHTTGYKDIVVNALDVEQIINLYGFYNVYAYDKDGNTVIIDDTLIKISYGYDSEIVIRDNTNHIYVVGDSLTDSGFGTYSMSYIAQIKKIYKPLFNIVSKNAIFGYTTKQELTRLQAFYNSILTTGYQNSGWMGRIENYPVAANQFKMFSIYIGTNDIVQQTDLSTFTSTYTEMIAYIKEKFTEANIFVIVPPKCNKKANAIDYCNAIKNICDTNSISYVDLSVIDELDSTKPDYDYTTYYLESDCIHFNQAGWDLVNALVIPKFAEVMQDKLIDEIGRLSS